MSAILQLPEIEQSSDGAWGPPTGVLPTGLKDVPYAPYNKSEKVGRIADWNASQASNMHNADGTVRRNQRYGAGRESGAPGSLGYFAQEDEGSFSLVDSKAIPARRGNLAVRGRGAGRGGRGVAPGAYGQRGVAGRGGRGGMQQNFGRGGRGAWGNQPQRTMRDASITVQPSWSMLEEMDFARIVKLSLGRSDPSVRDLSEHGVLYTYKKNFDRVNTKAPEKLEVVNRPRYNPTTSDDPVIQELVANNHTAKIYATDSILALLMSTPRTVYPWDMVITKEGPAGQGRVYFDKREGGVFDYVSVNENAADSPLDVEKEVINGPEQLSLEATYLNHNFISNVVDESQPHNLENANPFHSPEDKEIPASAGYKYKEFDLSVDEGENYTIVVRTETDAILPASDGTSQNFLIKALNESHPKSASAAMSLDWRTKLDTQRGAVVATEMKNNSSKLARWAIQGVLASVDIIKIGFIARINPKDNTKHIILGSQSSKPRDLISQMNVRLDNGWGIVRTVADILLGHEEGKYVLVRDPNRNILRLYSVPADFDHVEEGSENEEEDGQ